MFRSTFLLIIMLISLSIWPFPEFMQGVCITIVSSLFLLAHLSVTRIAINSDELTVKLPSSFNVYVAFSSGTKMRIRSQELEVRSLYHLYSLKTKRSRCHYVMTL